jgi:hypothetical protein
MRVFNTLLTIHLLTGREIVMRFADESLEFRLAMFVLAFIMGFALVM